MNKPMIKEIMSWIWVIAIGIALAWFVNRFVVFKVEIPTGSMENTIMIGDKAIVFRLSYLFKEPQRGDIIVFPYPDNENEVYIKRIIGLPNDTVEGRDGIVYINGEPLEEDYIKETMEWDFGPYEVPEDGYFMMGDNRNSSEDSRYWKNTFLKRNKIMGKEIFKYPKFEMLK